MPGVADRARDRIGQSAAAARRYSRRQPATEQPFVRANELREPGGDPSYGFIVPVVVVGHQPLVVAQIPDDPGGAGQFPFRIADETGQNAKPRARQRGFEDGLSRRTLEPRFAMHLLIQPNGRRQL